MTKCFLLISALLFQTATVNAQNITTIIGNGTPGHSGNGLPATSASIQWPSAVTIDAFGNTYINDSNQIRKIDGTGIISNFYNVGTYFGGTNCYDLVADGLGNIFYSDNNNFYIYKINSSGLRSVYAGTGVATYSGNGVPATSAGIAPRRMAMSNTGELYFADANERIRKISTAGIITTVAGNGTGAYTGDGGPATAAGFINIYSITIDTLNNLYVWDVDAGVIRKINASGIISRFAGDATPWGGTVSGDGGPATSAKLGFSQGSMAFRNGTLYLASVSGNRIRAISPSGTISTIAGNGTAGYAGDGGPAISAKLNQPIAITFDHLGNLLIADNTNSRIRKITYNNGLGVNSKSCAIEKINVMPNPTSGHFAFSVESMVAAPVKVTLLSATGRVLSEWITRTNEQVSVDLELGKGIYILHAQSENMFLSQKIACE